MRAFLSYSLNDSDQFVLTILAKKLKEQGFVVSSSYNYLNQTIDYQTFTQLNKSTLYIGIITATGNANSRVLKEWQQAINNKIPSLLLVEKGVRLRSDILTQQNVIRFDRNNPEPSIELVKREVSKSRHNVSVRNDNTLAWVFGGLALIAVIGLLANDD